MDAHFDGTQTRGMKGTPYDWQRLLVPAEPEFSQALDEIIVDGRPVTAESTN